MKILVSVIIPCYNVESYIKEAVYSVINQTYKNIEIICVDNNSTDKTLEILYELQKQLKSKFKVLLETKRGAPAARNKGLDNASGEWIQFLDADDILLPDKIFNQINLICRHYSDLGFVAGSYYKHFLNGKKVYENVDPYNDIYKSLFNKKLGNTVSNLWHRNSVNKVGKWNEDLVSSQEPELMFRLIKESHLPIIDKNPLTIIRQRPFGQISHIDPKIKWLNYLNLRLQILSYIKENNNNYFQQNQEFYLNSLFNIIRKIASFDISEGVKLYDEILGNSFIPNKLYSGCTSLYINFLKIFGYSRVEKIRNFIKKHLLAND